MGETRYSLAFDVEAVISVEVGIPSFHTSAYNEEENQMALHWELDLMEEKRNDAELRNAVYN